ncbi:hypothetical protein F4775DRAFT_534002 [Biscogniauxia sp. FL1348]|nr:hypothetical protein F4775DRAFT_534002 [Biscogniauxia sp. FL1348]
MFPSTDFLLLFSLTPSVLLYIIVVVIIVTISLAHPLSLPKFCTSISPLKLDPSMKRNPKLTRLVSNFLLSLFLYIYLPHLV